MNRMQSPDRIARELKGEGGRAERKRAMAASFAPEWMLLEEALEALDITGGAWHSGRVHKTLTTRPCSKVAGTGRGCGLLVKRTDVMLLAAIRKAVRLSIKSSCRVFERRRELAAVLAPKQLFSGDT